MTNEEIEEKVIEILKKYTRRDEVWESYSSEFEIINDLKINSARVIDIVIELEDAFKIRFTIPELDRINRVKDGVECIHEKVSK